MKPSRKAFIIERSRQLLIQLWRRRSKLLGSLTTVEDLFPLPIEILIRDLLAIHYEEPVEFAALTSLTLEVSTHETFGFMDRDRGRIVVPQNFKTEWRRFTAAHEVGHWVLHPEVKYHRDRPLTGAERNKLFLPPEEQEANLFAAYLLMPSRTLREYFKRQFGASIDGREPNEELAFWLSTSAGQTIDAIELAKRGAEYRGLLISQASSYQGRRFIPLADRFGVSPTAMAIQLKDLLLVR
jgi:hypothetical protein